jgi:short-subunit dehydrogenase
MKRAIVIGCSDGIGLTLARMLVERGWAVSGISRRESPLRHGGYTHAVVDVATPGFRETLDAIVEKGAVDACIYCAGIGDPLDLEDLGRDRHTFEVNLLAVVTTLEAVLPSMRRAQSGHVVVLSSQGDVLVSSAAPAYHASKAAVSSYIEGLALALRGTGVALTNVRFGFVDTKMAKASAKPFMITTDAAAGLVLRALERRPVRLTHPLSMAALVWLLGFATWLKIFWG